MLFVRRIYFEDVQTCLTIQRAIQIIVVTPKSDKNISHDEEEEEEEGYKLWPASKSDRSGQSLSNPAKWHASVTCMYTMAWEQSVQRTTAGSKKHPVTWSS